MAGGVGTLAWAARTGGRLAFRDRIDLLAGAIAYQLEVLPAQLRDRLGLTRSAPPYIRLTEIHAPDSKAAQSAEALCQDASPAWLLNHSVRSYLWARLLAARDGIRYDDELLYVACLLHDVGLTPRYADRPSDAPCFGVRGGAVAREVAREAEWDPARQDAVDEAIVLHLNVRVGREHGEEAHLLNAATALDVVGLRLWDVHPDTAREVLVRAPRFEMKSELGAVWSAEARARPGCRAHFLSRFLWFGRRIRAAPFSE